ncbi:hypothetical protein EJ06DRAFT_526587 [Trichodelitschia bisporula]|uniref:EthD domain-containing protein n=1 Tax=Trichodelitschia bisporula TaxID=703511 RepID=A0A6G1I8J7_9PEZI|nr:hypothetical protein EJ06DRAFT_526587 [Trichodelitschia bisporula]
MTHAKIDHKFSYDELAYDTPKNYQPCVKLSFFFNKLPNVSYEHFHRHWETVHADLAISAREFGLCGLKRYSQHHQTPDFKEKVTALGMDLMDYDGCSEIWVRSMDDWERFFKSPEYNAAMSKDCANFMGMPIRVMAGREHLVFGKAIPGLDGTDGITVHKATHGQKEG